MAPGEYKRLPILGNPSFTFSHLPPTNHFHSTLVVIASLTIFRPMTEQTKKEEEKEPRRKLKPEDYEIYHDSTSVMHFLPPKRCRSCDD